MTPNLRPMTSDDAEAVAQLQIETFGDLNRRFGREHVPPADLTPVYGRIRHLIGTDPGGAWVTEVDGEVRGAALALVREERLWGLSLLVVSPSHQSAGLGRSLLERTLAYGAEAAGGLILASADPRALRSYHRAGFDLRPGMEATGAVKRPPAVDRAVRELRWPRDREIVESAGRFVRGASHAPEVPVWLGLGASLYAHDGGGFAARVAGEVKVVAAHEPEVAAALLRAALRDVPHALAAEVDFITAGQDWAVDTILEAGLELRPSGALMARGETGPLAPYIPNGAYL